MGDGKEGADEWEQAMIPATPTGSNIAAGGKEVTACMVRLAPYHSSPR